MMERPISFELLLKQVQILFIASILGSMFPQWLLLKGEKVKGKMWQLKVLALFGYNSSIEKLCTTSNQNQHSLYTGRKLFKLKEFPYEARFYTNIKMCFIGYAKHWKSTSKSLASHNFLPLPLK